MVTTHETNYYGPYSDGPLNFLLLDPSFTAMLRLMRQKVTVETLKQFMRELAAAARTPGKVYLTGGATALLLGFREQTIDIDLKFDPEPEGVFEAIASLKQRLNLNIELASPDDFGVKIQSLASISAVA